MMKRYFKAIQPHINIAKLEAEIAFLPGPPERALAIANNFSSYEKVTKQRDFVTYTGEIAGKNVCVTSTGIGCPSAAIVVEELANCGVKAFIRVGTTGAIQADIELGDVIIPVAAVPDDGVVKKNQKSGILSFDMECAAVFTVAKLRGLKSGAVLGVIGNIVTEKHVYADNKYETKANMAVENTIKVAVGARKS